MVEFVNPSEILGKLKLRKDMVAADFGCGSGGWVLPLANIVNEGKIYAVDILEEKLSALKSRARMQKLANIETILDDAETKIEALPDESCDLVLMTNLLYLCEDKKAVLSEGKRVLKTGGTILVVDWTKDNPMTKEIEYVSFDEIKTAAKELGLRIIKEFAAGSYHLALIMLNPHTK
jgi:ubiquinone/menaquinone biosynthesis C-methylase UbiE